MTGLHAAFVAAAVELVLVFGIAARRRDLARRMRSHTPPLSHVTRLPLERRP